jgi:hypothetical protein
MTSVLLYRNRVSAEEAFEGLELPQYQFASHGGFQDCMHAFRRVMEWRIPR